MKVLIVEDDSFKLDSLLDYLEVSPIKNADIETANSVSAAKKCLSKSQFDLIILDMSLSTYTVSEEERGGRPQNFGGRDVLRYIRRKKIDTSVIVVTMYEAFGEGETHRNLSQLGIELQAEFENYYLGIVHFDTGKLWRDTLSEIINSKDWSS